MHGHAPEPTTIEVLYAGTIGIANDLTQVVRAAALLREWGRTEIHFTLLGDGNDRARVQQLAKSLDLQQVAFCPPVPYPEAMRRIADADIGLCCFAPFPVLESNGSSKFCDYVAAGTPVVLNYRGWQARLVEAYGCGLAVPQGDIAALALAIATLADAPPAARAAMAANGQQMAQALFNRRQLAIEMEKSLSAR